MSGDSSSVGGRPDLSEADLQGADLIGANLRDADLRDANLSDADLRDGHLSRADIRGADLSGADLRGADLTLANLENAILFGVDLNKAKLMGADMSRADLRNARLREARLSSANLSSAQLGRADLSEADLRLAKLGNADLGGVNLNWANLDGADFQQAYLSGTSFGNNDLSNVKGLESVIHYGPSTIGIDTLFRSDGTIAETFLRGAGVPEDFITFVPSFVGRAIEFYSCFISFSHHDEEFSRRLHSRMRSANLRVWYAPEDMKGGRRLHEEIFRAIQIHDKLLLLLSELSMKSEWVMTEIRNARKIEQKENRRKLFPIRLVDFETIEKWECFDIDSKKDLAIEVREYYVPDFSNWKDHDAFEAEFEKLVEALKADQQGIRI
jgi:uncharacterized protein YjbI with pentapeptide repeats